MEKYEISAQDADKIRALAALDKDSFAALISSAMSAMGMNKAQAAAISANSEAIRGMLMSASDSDIKKLAARLGREKTDELLGLSSGTSDGNQPT
ncbi:MAG: hypothetical protein E7633_09805 [Ruminococcaceae bacterium]|nr:hypothetical protein [Oscillospiraceae bacterium]